MKKKKKRSKRVWINKFVAVRHYPLKKKREKLQLSNLPSPNLSSIEEKKEKEQPQSQSKEEEVGIEMTTSGVLPKTSEFATTIVRRNITTVTTTTTTHIITIKYPKVVEASYKKISIYFCTYTYSKEHGCPMHNWYRFDPKHRTKRGSKDNYDLSTTTLESFSQMPLSSPQLFFPALVGSKLYCIGGSKLYSTGSMYSSWSPQPNTFICDPLSQPPIWEEYSPMNSAKQTPIGVIGNGNIFVFDSGSRVHELHPWGEVFYPEYNLWKSLPPPPDSTLKISSCVFSKERGEIFVFPENERQTYSYNLLSCSWKKIPVSISVFAKPLILGNILYSYDCGALYACDLSHSKPCNELIYGIEEETSKIAHRGNLFYIGKGKFCLLCYEGIGKDHKVQVYCLKFWVGTRNNSLHAVIDRWESYLAYGDSVCNYVATQDTMEGAQENQKN